MSRNGLHYLKKANKQVKKQTKGDQSPPVNTVSGDVNTFCNTVKLRNPPTEEVKSEIEKELRRMMKDEKRKHLNYIAAAMMLMTKICIKRLSDILKMPLR
jgi:hypothetical protein